MRAGAAKEDPLPVRAPAEHLIGGGMVGEPPWLPARGGHDVDVDAAVVLAREGEPAPVRAELGPHLHAGIARDAPGIPACGRDEPEIVLVGEDDPVAVDVGVAHEMRRNGRGGGGLGRRGCSRHAADRYRDGRQGEDETRGRGERTCARRGPAASRSARVARCPSGFWAAREWLDARESARARGRAGARSVVHGYPPVGGGVSGGIAVDSHVPGILLQAVVRRKP
jgi:hypothetical protein